MQEKLENGSFIIESLFEYSNFWSTLFSNTYHALMWQIDQFSMLSHLLCGVPFVSVYSMEIHKYVFKDFLK